MVVTIFTINYPPRLLKKGYKQELLNLYRNKYNTKSIKNGYIININNIVDIISTILDNNNNIIVKSLCDCNIFTPTIGLQTMCNIDMIHINGIFVSKYNIKILIVSDESYTYNNNTFIYKDTIYSKNDQINVELTNIRFEKNIYTCIGKLV